MHSITRERHTVKYIEHSAQRPFPATGLLAMLGVGAGCGGPTLASRLGGRRLLVRCSLVVIVAALALIAGSSSALASAPPSLEILAYHSVLPGPNPAVFSTRVLAEAQVRTNGLDTKWRAEYSTSKSVLEGGAGTIVSSGETPGIREGTEGVENIQLGPLDPGLRVDVLHHLAPATPYYARFVAENADSDGHPTIAFFEFTTLPVAKPEIDRRGLGEEGSTPARTFLEGGSTSPTTAAFHVQVESNGAATGYSFGYSTSKSGPFTSCGAAGSITVAEDFAEPEFHCTGLAPETKYFVRLLATNKEGAVEQRTYVEGGDELRESFTTPTARPVVFGPQTRNITGESAHVTDGVRTHGTETHWHFEYATSLLALDSGLGVVGPSGTISQAEAQAGGLQEGAEPTVGGTLTGLRPATTYYVRLFAENAAGEGRTCYEESISAEAGSETICEPISTATRGFASVDTAGPPSAGTLAVHTLHGESLRVIGAVDPNSEPTKGEQTITIEGAPTGGTFTLTFEGQTTEPIAFDASGEGHGSVASALQGLLVVRPFSSLVIAGIS